MNMTNFSKDEILKAMGLEARRTGFELVAPAVGLFAAGLLVGAGLGVLFAPKEGRELREDITRRMNQLNRPVNEEQIPTH